MFRCHLMIQLRIFTVYLYDLLNAYIVVAGDAEMIPKRKNCPM